MLQQPLMPAWPPQGRRFKLGLARIAFLMVLPAAGLGLLARTLVPNAPFAGTQEGVWEARDYLSGDQVASPSGSLQEILAHPDIIPTHHHSLLSRRAPDFELADTEGKVWNLRELRDGRAVVLIFYHGYHCVACVRQLFDVNRDLPLFSEVGARVVAISADPPEVTRQRFRQYGPFGFPVLSDPEHKVAQTYGVFARARDGKMADILRHGTFLIDRAGTVHWVNIGDAPFHRNPALLYQLGGNLP
jgi:peroxiredoxin Q/BCP